MFSQFYGDLRREFHGYNLASLGRDLMAGLTVCAVALPLALAFGVSSAASAAAGLVTAIIAGIFIGLLGGASFQISGPTGAMSAVLVAIVATHGLQGVFLACFFAGAVLLLCGLLKLGRLISFIPMPVVMGFTSGIALIIALGQIDNFFGTASQGSTALEKIASYASLGFSPKWQSTAIGLLVVAVMVFWPKSWGKKVPGSLVGIILASAVTALFGLSDLQLVGEIPKTLLLSERLSFAQIDWHSLTALLPAVVTISALAMIESLLCGTSASRMKQEPFHANRELVAQGLGNMLLPFFGGVPATAAIARTSVAIRSGAQTRLTSVFHSLFLLLSMFLLGGVMARLPMAALAAVLMVTAFRMNEWSGIFYLFQRRFKSGISQYLITMATTVIFDLTVAILIGVLYSAILHMSKAHIEVSFSHFDPKRLPPSEERVQAPDACVAYLTGSLFFGAVAAFHEAFAELPDCRKLIFSLRGMPSIDVSGVQAMLELVQRCQVTGRSVYFCGLADEVKTYFDRAGITEAAGGEEAFFWSADLALKALAAQEKQKE